MPVVEIQDVIKIARHAGQILMDMREGIAATEKSDGSPVTAADKASSDYITNALNELTPFIPVISEEAPEDQNRRALKKDSRWVVDPLDGTQTYIDGHNGFGVHIGLVRNGKPVLGVVFFPATDTLYYTGDDGKAYRKIGPNDPQQIRVKKPTPGEPLKLAVSWREASQPAADPASGLDIILKPGVGGERLCMAAAGEADAAWMADKGKEAVSFSHWDLCAAHAILIAAGGDLIDLYTHLPVRYNNRDFGVYSCVGGGTETLERLPARALTMPKP